MTQEDKDLLIKDLCARLPYKTLISIDGNRYIMEEIRHALIGIDTYKTTADDCNIEQVKPYLFPLSSMTEEQYDEIERCCGEDYLEHMKVTKDLQEKVEFITHFPIYSPHVIDYLNKNHFDYRGLIEKGLAIDATGLDIY